MGYPLFLDAPFAPTVFARLSGGRIPLKLTKPLVQHLADFIARALFGVNPIRAVIFANTTHPARVGHFRRAIKRPDIRTSPKPHAVRQRMVLQPLVKRQAFFIR